jgi:cbb3-type cytochrome oxidase subunit 1
MIEYLWPRLTNRQWWSPLLRRWTFWLCTVGLFVMFLDLLVIGVVQGYLWMTMAPWEEMIESSMPAWHVRTIAGTAIITGIMLLAYNMWMTARAGQVIGPASKTAEARTAVKAAAIKTADAKTADAKTADAKTADAKTADAKAADAKTADAKTADAKAEE